MNKLLIRTCVYFKHNSPTVLSFAGAAGVIATAVSAVMATPKALKLIKTAEIEKGEKLTKPEIIFNAGYTYVPTAVIGLSTIVCIFSADILNKRKQACLISAYSLLDSTFKNYRNHLKELYGEEADRKIIKTIIQNNMVGEVEVDSDGKTLFYDLYSERYFRRTLEEVQAAEYHLNRNFVLKGIVSLNDFYDFLGLEKTKAGEALGWSIDCGLCFYGYQWIDFEHELAELDDGLECYILKMPFGPTADYEEDVDYYGMLG